MTDTQRSNILIGLHQLVGTLLNAPDGEESSAPVLRGKLEVLRRDLVDLIDESRHEEGETGPLGIVDPELVLARG